MTEMSYISENRASDALQNLKYHDSSKFGRVFIRNESLRDYEIIAVHGKFHFGSCTICFICGYIELVVSYRNIYN